MRSLYINWKNTPYKNYLYLSTFLIAATSLTVFFLKNFLPPVVPLFYGKPLSESQLVPAPGLLIPLGVALVILIINLILNFIVKDGFLKKILIVSSFLVLVLMIITVVKIVSLVGFF